MTALIDGFSCRRFAARVNPFKIYCPLFAKMKLHTSISRWEKSSWVPQRSESPEKGLIVKRFASS
jgi:hypothetical protein